MTFPLQSAPGLHLGWQADPVAQRGGSGSLRGLARMNIFTTDHPSASQASRLETEEHPWISFACSTCVLALISTPWVLIRLYYWSISNIGAEPNPFPEPWLALAVGGAAAFAVSFLCACPVVFAARLFARHWRRN